MQLGEVAVRDCRSADLADRVYCGRVVAPAEALAEALADLRVAGAGQEPLQVHGEHPRAGEAGDLARPADVGDAQAEALGDGRLDVEDGDHARQTSPTRRASPVEADEALGLVGGERFREHATDLGFIA